MDGVRELRYGLDSGMDQKHEAENQTGLVLYSGASVNKLPAKQYELSLALPSLHATVYNE